MKIGLAFDGGGQRGQVSALIGAHIEREIGVPIASCVDCLAGASTGAIIALGAASNPPFSMQRMVQLYTDEGPKIFGKKRWRGWKGLFGAQYDRTPLADVLEKLFHQETLKSLTVPTSVVTYNLEQSRPSFLKSWLQRDHSIPIKAAAQATSAAWPVYFDPFILRNQALIDGGFVANNPAACCYADLCNLHPGLDQYTIISIGTGEATATLSQKQAMKGGIARQGAHVVEVLFDGSTDAFTYILRQIPRVRLLRMQPKLKTASHAMDDTSKKNIQALIDDTERFIEESYKDDSPLMQAIDVLRQRKLSEKE